MTMTHDMVWKANALRRLAWLSLSIVCVLVFCLDITHVMRYLFGITSSPMGSTKYPSQSSQSLHYTSSSSSTQRTIGVASSVDSINVAPILQLQNHSAIASLQANAGNSILVMLLFTSPISNPIEILSLIRTWNIPTQDISLGILTTSPVVHSIVVNWLHNKYDMIGFAQVTLLERNDFTSQLNSKEHARNMARYRNYALFHSMALWHQHVIWIDPNIKTMSSNLINNIINAHEAIVQPKCIIQNTNSSCCQDAFRGQRRRPTTYNLDEMATQFEPKTEFAIDWTSQSQKIVPLDAVDTHLLYIRADLHRQGILFPTYAKVGTTWLHEGYDAINAQGICLTAKFLGYSCYGMPHETIELEANH